MPGNPMADRRFYLAMMDRLQTAARQRLPQWTLAGVTLGFIVILAELALTGHTQGAQGVGVLASLGGIALTLAALWLPSHRLRAVVVLLAILSLSGLAGVALHAEERAEGAAKSRAEWATIEETYEGRSGEAEAQRPGAGGPPPLAPLSLSGLGLLGALATLGRGRNPAAAR